MKRQLGFSLSDILISLALSSLLLGSLFQCYLGGKKIYMEAEALLSEQFDVQWVSDMLADSIERAGFTPCLSLDRLQTLDRRTESKQIAGFVIVNQGLVIRRMNEHFVPLLRVKNLTQIEVAQEVLFNVKQPLILADCSHAEIHQILSIESLPHSYLITLTKPLRFIYEPSAYVGHWLEEKWLIKKNKEGKKALYFQSEQTEELTMAIHSLIATQEKGGLVKVNLGLEKTLHQLMVAIRA